MVMKRDEKLQVAYNRIFRLEREIQVWHEKSDGCPEKVNLDQKSSIQFHDENKNYQEPQEESKEPNSMVMTAPKKNKKRNKRAKNAKNIEESDEDQYLDALILENKKMPYVNLVWQEKVS